MGMFAVGLIVDVDGVKGMIVDAIDAANSAEALGKMIINSNAKIIHSWSIKGADLDNDVRLLVKDNKKIHAIKLVRETLGISLSEAKQYVDKLI